MTDWKFFSPLDCAIMNALVESGPLSRRELATATGEAPDGRIKRFLAELVERHILVTTPDGYAINCPSDQRDEMIAWLADVCQEPR